jgi:outer membrane PBP1 activator LpoA protein
MGGAVLTAPMSTDAAIALLLPLSGKQEAAALAVRDGFAAAWFASGSGDVRTRVEVYDTTAGVAAAYQRALADGVRVVVGPLLKEEVVALINAQPSGLPVPTLALNAALPEGSSTPAFLYQFALDPEQDARAVARRIAEDGLVRGIALFPEGAWGERIRAAFVDELGRLGTVALSGVQFYEPGAKDFTGPLRAALGRFGGAGDRSTDRSKPTPTRNAAAEQAAGPQFAFIAASPQAARAIRPQLRFQMTYDLPVYATSDAWEPSVRSVSDLEGMVFPEMPWLLYGGQGAPELWDALQAEWASRARGRLRLFAFGYDAFRLAQQLGSGSGAAGLQGLTGTLEIQRGDGRVRRSLQFARVEGGRPQPALAGPPAFPAGTPTNTEGATSPP